MSVKKRDKERGGGGRASEIPMSFGPSKLATSFELVETAPRSWPVGSGSKSQKYYWETAESSFLYLSACMTQSVLHHQSVVFAYHYERDEEDGRCFPDGAVRGPARLHRRVAPPGPHGIDNGLHGKQYFPVATVRNRAELHSLPPISFLCGGVVFWTYEQCPRGVSRIKGARYAVPNGTAWIARFSHLDPILAPVSILLSLFVSAVPWSLGTNKQQHTNNSKKIPKAGSARLLD